jgi:DNA-binding LytR/AlgR family response regulator
MTCIITDDEPLARMSIVKLLSSHKQLQVIAQCKNAQELQHILATQEIDLVFLDLEMPVMNGMEFLKTNQTNTAFIITTAYHQFALQSYEFNILDYLIKPIAQDRFDKAIDKAIDYLKYTNYKQQQENFIFVKCDKIIEKIYFDEILYIEAMRNYVVFHMSNGKHIHYASISSINQKLDQSIFLRVQKSYIVNIQKVTSYSSTTILIHNKEISIARTLKQQVLERVQKQSTYK